MSSIQIYKYLNTNIPDIYASDGLLNKAIGCLIIVDRNQQGTGGNSGYGVYSTDSIEVQAAYAENLRFYT